MVLDFVRQDDQELVILSVVEVSNKNPVFSLHLFPSRSPVNTAGLVATTWPGGARQEATPLFDTGKQKNWSGAHCNEKSQTLWLARNNAGIQSHQYGSSGWESPELYKIKADIEGITQDDCSSSQILVIAENDQEVRQYELKDDSPRLLNYWDVSNVVENKNGLEGIVLFQIDSWPSSAFRMGRVRRSMPAHLP